MKTGWKIALGFVGLTCVAGVLGSWLLVNSVVDFPIESGKLDQRVKEARQEGVPLVLADLNAPGQIPDSQNAQFVLVQATEALQRAGGSKAVNEAQSAAVRGDMAGADRLLKPMSRALELAVATSKKPHYRLREEDWEYPLYFMFPDLAELKNLAKALATRARVRASQGNLAGAESDLDASYRLGRFAAQTPALIGGLVSISIHGIVNAAWMDIAAAEFDRSRPVQRLAPRIAENRFNSTWDWMLRSEAFWAVQTTRNLDRLGGLGSFSLDTNEAALPPRPTIPARTHELPADMVTRSYMSRVLEAWTQVFRERREKKLTPIETGELLDKVGTVQEGNRQLSRNVVRVIFPVYFQAAAADAQASARDELLKGYVGALSHRQRTGKWPSSLEEVGLQLIDPFDKKPIRYKSTGSGFRIWSIGSNRKDDQGVSLREAGAQDRADVVMMYPPERRG